MATFFTNIKERVLYYTDYKGFAKEKFFEELGVTYGNFKGKAKEKALSSDILAKIVSKYPEINAEWLLLGKGEMLKTNIIEDSNNDCSHYKELAEERAYTIQMQKEIINNLREENALLKKDTKYPISSKSSL